MLTTNGRFLIVYYCEKMCDYSHDSRFIVSKNGIINENNI